MITQSKVQELFNYVDGELYWKVRPMYSHIDITKPAGSIDKYHGYRIIMISKKHYRAHRVVFMYHHNHLPKTIDHINNDKTDNHIENLRPASDAQNSGNAKLCSRNRSGFKGVHFNTHKNKWRGGVCLNGNTTYTDNFSLIGDAVAAVKILRVRLHGEYANNG